MAGVRMTSEHLIGTVQSLSPDQQTSVLQFIEY
jgi:hypothetical protein